MGLRALFTHSYNRRLEILGEYDDELEMDRTLFTFFDLAYDIRSFVLGMPFL